jgi:hypothetical protein
MAHFAEIDENNIVIRVLVVPDDEEHRGHDFLANDLNLGGIWLKTSYNTVMGEHLFGKTPYRKNYAGIGFTYDVDRDAFIPPKPFPSWVLDENACIWEAPIPRPNNYDYYVWNEELLEWKLTHRNTINLNVNEYSQSLDV